MVWEGFFTGLMDYQKEVDENKKYKEAFKLKKDAFDLDLEKFELEKETLEYTKQKNRDDNFIDMVKIINKNGGYGAGRGYGSGPMYDTSGKYTGQDNAHYSQQIITEFPNIDKASVAKVMAATNLSPDVGYRMYTALTALRDAKQNKQLSEEDLSSFFIQVVQTEVSPNTSFSDIDTTDVSPYLTDLLSQFELGSFTQTTFPTPIEEKPFASVADNRQVERIVYDSLNRKYEKEIAKLIQVQKNLQVKKDANTASADEISIFEWATLRLTDLNEIKGKFSIDDPETLFKFYGSGDAYSKLLPKLKQSMDVQFPEDPLMFGLDYKAEPVVVPNISMVVWLRDNGLLEVGDRVLLTEPYNGRYQILVPEIGG